MTQEQDLTGLVKAVKEFNKELENQKEVVQCLRDTMHTIHLSFAGGLDKQYKKVMELCEDIERLKRENRREATRKDFDLDSIELGTPEKGGRVKIYINSRQYPEDREQIDATIEAMEYLKKKMEVEE